ncbi:3Beta_HSD domain-containing protein/Reticulon domain-containing protein [Cephalotus follicularis]|uniref:Reticulon-like protein n=1 Tax=Cephalotus follicularis TaxID=3775 RepID=A0A1Q3B8L8_CEPFO|nr:3Beta_HSD domain-containing protein/Reticulon domain-containing protein [Cephalotus follicularis]
MATVDDSFRDARQRTCVVLGGRGFLGRSLVLRLLKLGDWIVRVADSTQSIQLDHRDSLLADSLSNGRASFLHVDVRDQSQVLKAVEGSSVVFYTETSGLDTHDFFNCYMIIVQGTKNVINACRECKVRRLIYNSTADVVFDGSHDIHNGDESLSCKWNFLDTLTDLRAQAEALVLFANNIDGLLTCVLRPSNVFGPGDSQLLPFLVNLAKSGWAKFIIGSGENMSDFTYAENVTHAHICAAEALDSRMVFVAGKAFFITNHEPVKFWEFVSLLLESLGYQRPLIKVPSWMFWQIILLVKWTREKLGFRNPKYSLSAHYIVQLASRTRTFDCTAAKKHLGYSPIVSLEEGVMSTVESFSHLAKDSSSAKCGDFNEQSKVDKLLGSGKAADIFLWRDEKETFTYFLVLALLFYWFFLCGRTFASSAAKLLLLITVILYGYGVLPSRIFGFTVHRMSSSCFEVSETVVIDSVRSLAYLWNRGVNSIRSMAKGDDWNNFLKAAVTLYLLKLIVSQSVAVVIGVALILAFTAFFLYEQYESEIDGLVKVLFDFIKGSNGLVTRKLPACVTAFLHEG